MALAAVVAALMATACGGLHVQLHATAEERRVFSVEEFGFLAGGKLQMDVTGFAFGSAAGQQQKQQAGAAGVADAAGAAQGARAGFLVLRADTEKDILNGLHEEIREEFSSLNRSCPFDDKSLPTLFSIEFSAAQPEVTKQEKKRTITPADEGLYDVTFVRCGPDVPIAFSFSSEMVNPGPNHLSGGETPLPSLLTLFSLVYVGMLAGWIRLLRRHSKAVHKIHHLLTAFMVLKVLAVFSEAADKHYVKLYGYALAWDLVSHLLRSLRAVMFFIVVVLLGAGWSLLKPALNDRERKVLLFVLPTQLLANIALVVADEMPRGSSAFMRWRDMFQLVDFLCCMAIFVPIFAHIQHLESQGRIDGKAQINLAKLRQFRRFYVLVLAYVYLTRVVLFLLGNSLPFKLKWLEVLFKELVSVVFYCVIAYSFRPASESPYLRLPADESDDYEPTSGRGGFEDDDPFDQDMFFEDEHRSEFGLREDIELTAQPAKRQPSRP